MLVRVGTCTNCEALFQLPESFGEPWVRCTICEGAVRIGEPMDPAEAGKGRRGGRARSGSGSKNGSESSTRSARPRRTAAGAGAAGAVAATAAKAASDAKPETTERPAPKSEPTPVKPAASEPVEAPLEAPVEPPAPEIPARPVAPKWSPQELERRAEAQAPPTPAAPPAPEAPSTPQAQPAPKAQPRPAELPRSEPKRTELEEIVPSRRSSGTLERLKRERAVQAAARDTTTAESSSDAKPESTLERLKRERAEQAAAAGSSGARKSAAAAPSTPSTGRTQSRTGGRSRRSQEQQEAPEPSRRSSRSGRSGRGESSGGGSSSRRRSGAHHGKQKSPVAGLVGIGALAVLGTFGYLTFKNGWLSSSTTTEPDTEVAQGEGDGDGVLGAGETITVDPFAGTPTPAAAEATETADGDAADGEAAEAPADGDAGDAEASGTPEPAPEPAKKVADPDDVDLAQFGTFEKHPDTSDEDWAEITKQAGYLFDVNSGKKGGTAKEKLEAYGKGAFPAILNGLLALDLGKDDDMRVGNEAVRVLEEICNGYNFSWRQSTEPNEHYYNRRVVERWSTVWNRVLEDPSYWFTLAKLDPETGEPL